MGDPATTAKSTDISTFGQIGLGASALSAGLAVGSAFYNAKIQKSTLEAQAQISLLNAKMADLSAKSAIQSGMKEEQSSRLRMAGLKSTQRASMAARGIDLSSDSSVNVLTTTDYINEIDANQIRMNAYNQAFGIKTQAANLQSDAIAKKLAAGSINPAMSGATSLLTNATSVARDYYLLKKGGGGVDLLSSILLGKL